MTKGRGEQAKIGFHMSAVTCVTHHMPQCLRQMPKNKPILSHVTSDTPVTVAIKSEMMGPEQICIAAREAYVTPTASG
jgi:hypothetical protein